MHTLSQLESSLAKAAAALRVASQVLLSRGLGEAILDEVPFAADAIKDARLLINRVRRAMEDDGQQREPHRLSHGEYGPDRDRSRRRRTRSKKSARRRQ